MAELHLHKPTASLTAHCYAALAESDEADVLRRAVSAYESNRQHYDSQMVRDIVGRALHEAAPVSVRPSGGVYFIAREFRDRVTAVSRFVDLLGSGSGSRLYQVPVLDDADARSMVADSVEAQVGVEAERVITDLRGLLQAGKPSTPAMEGALRSLRSLDDMTARYEGLLQDRIDGARAALEAAQAQARSLLEAV